MTLAPASRPVQQKFTFVPEWDDFLDLFPHRGSYLWAEHPDVGDRPDWQTEARHLLSDRLIIQGSYLYGVRFGKTTNYILIDIDRGSPYHPAKDPLAIGRIIDTLEPLGLVTCIPLQSSYSGGIHLYFPFAHGQKSWAIARAVESLLQSGGYKPRRGHLELFPNPRQVTGIDYNGHRLPLQAGSYLLNEDFESVLSSRGELVRRWRHAENHNDTTTEAVDLVLKQFNRSAPRRLRYSAQKFLNDLNAEIEPGWTSHGQTNHILGKIALREYVFFPALYGTPLTGWALGHRILEVAVNLPGYDQFCGHQHQIVKRCEEYARAVEADSRYYPYGGDATLKPLEPPSGNTWNQQQAEDGRRRIEAAIADLQAKGQYPDTIRARLFAIKAYGISSNTLYKNCELWHVEKQLEPAPRAMFSPVQTDSVEVRSPEPAPRAMISPTPLISLYADRERPPKGACTEESSERAVGGSGGLSTSTHEPPALPSPAALPSSAAPLDGVQFVRQVLNEIRQRQTAPPSSSSPPDPPPDENWFRQWQGGSA
jgi:hypothetical protein